MMNDAPVSPLALNCPRCPRRMDFITSSADGIYLYHCADHGYWQLGPGGLSRLPQDKNPLIQPDPGADGTHSGPRAMAHLPAR